MFRFLSGQCQGAENALCSAGRRPWREPDCFLLRCRASKFSSASCSLLPPGYPPGATRAVPELRRHQGLASEMWSTFAQRYDDHAGMDNTTARQDQADALFFCRAAPRERGRGRGGAETTHTKAKPPFYHMCPLEEFLPEIPTWVLTWVE